MKAITVTLLRVFLLVVFFFNNKEITHAQNLRPLSSLVLTPEVIVANNVRDLGYFTNTTETLWIDDRSEELNGHCPVDCVKQVWYVPVRSYWPDGYRKLTVTLIRTATPEQAQQGVQSLYQLFTNLKAPGFFDHTDDFNKMIRDNTLTDTWALYNNTFTISASYNSIIILLSMKMRGFHDIDDFGEISALMDFARLQVSILKNAGY
jgi:hypothetical protein